MISRSREVIRTALGSFPFAFSMRLVDHQGEERSREQRGKDCDARRHRADGREDIPDGRIFQEKARRAGLDEFHDVKLGRDQTHPDDFHLGQFPLQRCHQAQAILIAQPQVDKHHMGVQPAYLRERIVIAAGGCHDRQIGLLIDDRLDAITQNPIVLDQKDLDLFRPADLSLGGRGRGHSSRHTPSREI